MALVQRIKVESLLCRDCQACALGCSLFHESECHLGLSRVVVTKDMTRYEFDILICQHCDDPDCIAACPGDAMVVNDRGVVVIQDHECNRCGACASSCPYDAIFYRAGHDRYLKCDLCAGRDAGPLCVELCPVGALSLIDVVDVMVAEES